MMQVDEYLQAKVLTASPQRLHLMIVDQALTHSRRTAQALADGDLATSHHQTVEARKFVTEVISGLRTDQSPELVTQVKDYFLHVHKLLYLADMKQDQAAAAKAIELLEGYRETWLELTSHVPATA